MLPSQLFDYTNTDKELLDALIEKVYPEIATVDFEKLEAVLFTATIKSFTSEEKKYVEKIQEYMNCRYKNILVKKHPRDTIEYEFAPDMEISECSSISSGRGIAALYTRKGIGFCVLFSNFILFRQCRK